MFTEKLSRYIDHTLLAANTTEEQIKSLCTEAKNYKFYSVCVNSSYVSLACSLLKDSSVKICSVVGFPLGAMISRAKAFEAKVAVENGANEIDMVINIGFVKSSKYDLVEDDIAQVKLACGSAKLKVILETCLLTDEEIKKVCNICKKLEVAFVKTSTGFSTGGATAHHVTLMKEIVGNDIEVKASGGVRSKEKTLQMIEAGATRIGTSSGIAIVEGSNAPDKSTY